MKTIIKLVTIAILVTFSYSIGDTSEPAQKAEPAEGTTPAVRKEAKPVRMVKPAIKSGKKTTAKQKVQNLKYSSDSINMELQKLPPKYLGHDLRTIYSVLEKRKEAVTKGEFETTEKYDARILALEKKPVIGKLGINDVFVLSVSTGFNYDADKSFLTVKLDSGKLIGPLNIENKLTISGPEISNRVNQYIGSNAYGASTEIISRFTEASNLVVLNPEVFGMKDGSQYYGGIIYKFENITIEKAKALKDKLRVLVAFKLKEPYISRGVDGRSATYDIPLERTETHHNVYSQVIGSWIYNIDTGEILLKESYK